ncbi:MAG TPA: hypothetical protein VGL80_12885 [Pseudonocardiaceae bacterium]
MNAGIIGFGDNEWRGQVDVRYSNMFPVASVRLETCGAPVDGEVADKDINSYNGAQQAV